MEDLTGAEKNHLLIFLDDQISKGWVHKEFIPYLRAINLLDDFCTTQCCTGHRKRGYPSEYHTGELRFRLSARAMDALRANLTIFYQHPNILNIDVRYHRGRKWAYDGNSLGIYEEVMITFLGVNRSRSHFKDSIEFIVNVLQMMQRELDLKYGYKNSKHYSGIRFCEKIITNRASRTHARTQSNL